jgi:hypothetical protein
VSVGLDKPSGFLNAFTYHDYQRLTFDTRSQQGLSSFKIFSDAKFDEIKRRRSTTPPVEREEMIVEGEDILCFRAGGTRPKVIFSRGRDSHRGSDMASPSARLVRFIKRTIAVQELGVEG